VETELLIQADRLVGGCDAVLVIDDTALAKYASALVRPPIATTSARGEVPVMLALRLFLPEVGQAIRHGWSERVCRPTIEPRIQEHDHPRKKSARVKRLTGGQAAGDRLHISREDSRIIASAVFDVLRRANVLLIDQPGQANPETA
jgi:hypothetical protein